MVGVDKTIRSIKKGIKNINMWMRAGKILKDGVTISQCVIEATATIFTSPGLGGGCEIDKTKIKGAFFESFRKEQTSFNCVAEGVRALIQRGDPQRLNAMAEDSKLKDTDILRYAKDVDDIIAFSQRHKGNQQIKPRN